jgi:hypothetical protein
MRNGLGVSDDPEAALVKESKYKRHENGPGLAHIVGGIHASIPSSLLQPPDGGIMSPITTYRPKSGGTRGSREWTALPPSVREWVKRLEY